MGGWVGGFRYIIKPLRGPTCKLARFQAELKFPSWAECGKMSEFDPRNLIGFDTIEIKKLT